jgi:hypothetical protein
MAFAVPIVAFDLGEIRAAADGAAVCVSPGDVPAFARAISQLLDDPARRAGMGRLSSCLPSRRVAERNPSISTAGGRDQGLGSVAGTCCMLDARRALTACPQRGVGVPSNLAMSDQQSFQWFQLHAV